MNCSRCWGSKVARDTAAAPVGSFRGRGEGSCAVGLANLDLIEREQLIPQVRELGKVLADSLAPLADHELVAEVRAGTGLLAAVEIAEEARMADPGLILGLVAEIREHGVITRGLRGAALQVSPPFIITEREIGQIIGTFAAALGARVRHG